MALQAAGCVSASSARTSANNSATAARRQLGIIAIHSIALLAPLEESACLLFSSLPSRLTAALVGELFAAFGRLSVTLVLTQREGLAAVLLFERVSAARRAYAVVNERRVQVETRGASRPESHSSGSSSGGGAGSDAGRNRTHPTSPPATCSFVAKLQFARYPLQVHLLQPMAMRLRRAHFSARSQDSSQPGRPDLGDSPPSSA